MRETSGSEISDITEINSDDELPFDSIGDYCVISLKGVLKEIISCGSGYEKPCIGDELIIEIESSNSNINKFQDENKRLKLILGDHSMDEYDSTRKKEIPWGIEMALRKMLKGEKSKVLVRKGSIFSKSRDSNGKACSNSIIHIDDCKNYNHRSKKLINLIKKEANEFDEYIITLHDFYRIEMICDKVNKKVWKKGVHLKSPNKKDKVELMISKLQFERILDNFATPPKICEVKSELNWVKLSLNLDNLTESYEKVKEIFGIETFSLNDLTNCILSLKLGEISEFRICCCNNEKLNLLIHLTGFYWEKIIQIKLPFNKEIQDHSVKLSSFENETIFNDYSTSKGTKLSTKRISSLNLEYNTRINILLENFTLVDKNNQGKRTKLSLPFKFTENMKTAFLQITPGFYNLPIWLEQSIHYCFLGGKYTIQIPLSIIFLFPPMEIEFDKNIEIHKKTKSLIILEKNNSSTLNSNACNSNSGNNELHAIWEAGKLVKELEDLGYKMDNNIEKNLGIFFELDLSICTRDIVENYIPISLSNSIIEFEYYYYLGKTLSNYNDIIYKIPWNILTLEVIDKFLYVANLLPFYSKLTQCKKFSNDIKFKLIEKENEDNCMNDKNEILNNYNQKRITLKYDNNFVEDLNNKLTRSQITDSILVTYTAISNLEGQEREHLKYFINVINIILKIYYDMCQFEKCSNLLKKYQFLLEFKSNKSNFTELNSLKDYDSNNICQINDLNLN